MYLNMMYSIKITVTGKIMKSMAERLADERTEAGFIHRCTEYFDEAERTIRIELLLK